MFKTQQRNIFFWLLQYVGDCCEFCLLWVLQNLKFKSHTHVVLVLVNRDLNLKPTFYSFKVNVLFDLATPPEIFNPPFLVLNSRFLVATSNVFSSLILTQIHLLFDSAHHYLK